MSLKYFSVARVLLPLIMMMTLLFHLSTAGTLSKPKRSEPKGSSSSDCDGFKCLDTGKCIPVIWLCDHDDDCTDNSDQSTCPHPACHPDKGFNCSSSGRCIYRQWVCDGDNDCGDHSDEANCPSGLSAASQESSGSGSLSSVDSASEAETIESSGTVSLESISDGDTGGLSAASQDGSGSGSLSSAEGTSEAAEPACEDGFFRCPNGGRCIAQAWLCDGDNDCGDNSDENPCPHPACFSTDRHNCTTSGRCIKKSWLCDGDNDCRDNSDESNCDDFVIARNIAEADDY